MAKASPKPKPSSKPARKHTAAAKHALPSDSASSPPTIRCTAKLRRPAAGEPGTDVGDWMFLMLPEKASAELPSRGMVSIEGTINGGPLLATLEPDGQGGHWLKVDRRLQLAAGAAAKLESGASVTLEFTPVPPDREPEPDVPADLRQALAAAPAKARHTWADITPVARRDWIHWITSGKRAETRTNRVATACDMLAKGKRRACCFDRSGMYSNSLTCPVAAPEDR